MIDQLILFLFSFFLIHVLSIHISLKKKLIKKPQPELESAITFSGDGKLIFVKIRFKRTISWISTPTARLPFQSINAEYFLIRIAPIKQHYRICCIHFHTKNPWKRIQLWVKWNYRMGLMLTTNLQEYKTVIWIPNRIYSCRIALYTAIENITDNWQLKPLLSWQWKTLLSSKL